MSGFTAKSSGGDFVRHLPSVGLVDAVVVDVIDIGNVVSAFKNDDGSDKVQHKVTVVWEIREPHPELDGPHRLYKTFTMSLHEKASLAIALEGIRGKKFTDAERKEGFDLDKLLGVPCRLLIQHEEANNGNTYAKIGAYMPADKASILSPSGRYEPNLKDDRWISAYALKNGVKSATPGRDAYQEAIAAITDDDGGLPF